MLSQSASSNVATQYQSGSKELEKQIKERDRMIASLVDQLNNISQSDVIVENEREHFKGTLTAFRQSIGELESKLAVLALDNERLTGKCAHKDEEINR
jgi:septal ring factor EnvC (AmiA/AmiB activator)